MDPLGLHSKLSFPHRPPTAAELDYAYHGFAESDLDRDLVLKGTSTGGNKGYLEDLANGPKVTLRQVISTLKKAYCGTLGVEYMHIGDPEKINWLRERIENPAWNKYGEL